MIGKLRAKGFRCLHDVDVALTPFHAFIGPNDTGKSTILNAIRCLGWGAEATRTHKFEELQARVFPTEKCELAASGPPGISPFSVEAAKDWALIKWPGAQPGLGFGPAHGGGGSLPDTTMQPAVDEFARMLSVRLNQAALTHPSPILTEAEAARFPEDTSVPLSGVLELLHSRATGMMEEITAEVTRLFPTVARITTPTVQLGGEKGKALRVHLRSGEVLDAHAASEGLLYYLALAAMIRVGLPKVLLIEEPENGLHPARIAEVMRVLRAAAKDKTQVIMATHSPLVINEMLPEEVTLVTRTLERGTICTPIKNTRAFAERSSVYALGELWLSYANGVDEKDLIVGDS